MRKLETPNPKWLSELQARGNIKKSTPKNSTVRVLKTSKKKEILKNKCPEAILEDFEKLILKVI